MTDVVDRSPLHLVRPGAPRRPEPKFPIIAGLIVLVLVLVGWIIAARTPSGHHASAPVTASPIRPVVVTPPARPGASTACHLPAGGQAIPTSIPADVTWSLYQTLALPSSPSSGPEYVTSNGDARCFAHNPVGALIADTAIQFRDVTAPDWRQIIATQVVPGPGATILAEDRAKLTPAEAAASPGSYCQYAGMAWLSYTPSKAVMELVSRCGEILQAMTTTVAWSGTDWKLVLQPAGGVAPSAVRLDSLVGFLPFGGV